MGCCASKKDTARQRQDIRDSKQPEKDTSFSKNLAEMYKRYDANHDGSLDYNETKQLLRNVMKEQGQPVDEEKLDETVKRTDTNSDGRISKKELYALFKKMTAKGHM